MSAIAVRGGSNASVGPDALSRMLGAMERRGDVSRAAYLQKPPIAMAAMALPWQRPAEAATVAEVTVIADASLYYRADLLRRGLGGSALAAAQTGDAQGRLEAHGGTDPRELSDARAIAAVWAKHGPRTLDWLEGDFAIAVWDAARNELIVARDPVGTRTVYFAWHEGVLRVASTIAAVLADGALPRRVDLATLATVAGGGWSHSTATSYQHVSELRAGQRLSWRPGQAPQVSQWWHPPMDVITRRQPLDPAADELRDLLREAVRERLAPDGATGVSLSGGWDSTSVYASGRSLTDRVHAVSISYPPGDPGREDETIAMVTQRWNATPDFIESASIPMFVQPEEAAARRDHPFAHVYEHWNRALSRRARATDARVILDGVGGDNLFQVSDLYLAELFRSGQWGELRSQWRTRGGDPSDWRGLYRAAVKPVIPDSWQARVAKWRGWDFRYYLERRLPTWIRWDFLNEHRVIERDREAQPSLPSGNLVRREQHVFLTFPFYQRVYAHLHAFGLEEGLEVRSPLIDNRVVQFAARRPWSDRADGLETKRLLRRAMRDLLPAEVLAPRPHRTGTTNAYFVSRMRDEGWPIAEQTLADSRLEAIGMVDTKILRDAWSYLLRADDSEVAGRLFFTLQAELWMRTHSP